MTVHAAPSAAAGDPGDRRALPPPLAGRRRLCRRHTLAVGFLAGAIVFGGVSPAWAGSAFTTVAGLPSTLFVGQTGVPGSLTMTNASTGAQASQNLTVSAITLVANCGTQAISGGDCPLAAVDPGVLRLSLTGSGEAGTVCAGRTFAIGVSDPAQGKYLFSAGAPVVLGATGSPDGVCMIDFTLEVVKAPARDADPALPGMQTAATAFALGVSADGLTAGGFATTEATISGTSPVATPLSSAAGPIGAGGDPSVPAAPQPVQAASLHATAASAPAAAQPRAAARCVVPKLKGYTLAKARHALRQAHCTVGIRRQRDSRRRRASRVVAQQPRAGGVLAPATRVTITLGSGG
jgi:hypothetical protein